MPNSRASEDRATIENVMPQASTGMTAITSISTSHSGRASPATTMPVDTGRRRATSADGPIHRLAKPRIRQIDRDFADVLEAGAGFTQELIDVGHRLLGLRRHIPHSHIDRRIEVLADLAAHEHHSALCHDVWHRSLSSFCSG